MSEYCVGIIDASNQIQQVPVGIALHSEAEAAKAPNFMAHLDNKILTRPDQPTASQQVYARMGMNRKDLSLADAMSGKGGYSAAASVQDGSITGRLVTQAFLMNTIENKLLQNDYGLQALFIKKAALSDSINSTRFDIPIIDFTRPSGARSKPVAQLSEPTSMMTITGSSKSYSVQGNALGIEYSDTIAQNTTLNLVALSMARQAEVESLERIENNFLSFVNGDSDLDMAALSGTSVKNAKIDFDASLVAGQLSQKAWVSWLFQNSRSRQINTVITDLAGALAISNRIGRPTVTGDNATSVRIDTLETVVNPTWPDKVDVIISQDPNWPANTLVGFDSRYGYRVVTSLVLAYSASEQFAMRRSTKLRIDSGSAAHRFMDDAWAKLTLT